MVNAVSYVSFRRTRKPIAKRATAVCVTCFCHLTAVWSPLAEERLAISTQSIHRWKVHLVGYNSVADNTVYLHSFSCYWLRNTRNVAKFQENLTLQQFKVIQGHIDLGVNGKQPGAPERIWKWVGTIGRRKAPAKIFWVWNSTFLRAPPVGRALQTVPWRSDGLWRPGKCSCCRLLSAL